MSKESLFTSLIRVASGAMIAATTITASLAYTPDIIEDAKQEPIRTPKIIKTELSIPKTGYDVYEILSRPAVYNVPTTPYPIPAPTPCVDLIHSEFNDALLEDALASSINAFAHEQYIHIILAGVDRRSSSGNSRADVIMIATLDRKHRKIKITSILRDTLVYIPGRVNEYRKINAASSKGGMDLLVETVRHNFGIDAVGYVMVDFQVFANIIDAMGGISLEMTAKEISAANDCIAGLNKQTGYPLRDGFIVEPAGTVHLNGKQALGYARIRKIDSDFKRTERQFELIQTALDQFLDLPASNQLAIMKESFGYVETNIDIGGLIGICTEVIIAGLSDMSYFQIPAKGMYKSGKYNGSYALLADVEKNTAALHSFMLEE